MYPPAVSSRRVVWTVVGVLIVLALLPRRFCVYGPPLRDLTIRLLAPLAAPLTNLSTKLRPAADRPVFAGSDLDKLSEELRLRDGMILALKRRVAELETTNAELQGLRSRRASDSFVFRAASIIGRSADPAATALNIDIGSVDEVGPGFAAVDGANLIGRVVQVGRTTSTVAPLASLAILLEVVFTPPEIPIDGLPPERNRTCLLKARGRDSFIADDVDQTLMVQVGDFARLSDRHGGDGWPSAVQGMIIGQVVKVENHPDDPLRKRIEVRPLVSPRSLSSLTIIVPRIQEAKP